MATKIVTLEELQAHTKKDSLYVLLHNKVYDVTKFIDEHPGGDEVIMAEAGKDATEAFEDVGHSDEARGLLKDMLIGDFEQNSALPTRSTTTTTQATTHTASQSGSSISYFIPLALLAAYFAWRFYSGAA
ncbi:cytochrome b5 [Rickenella mellea]|uniref:Cytochrome b5 n=1 Tax=Rickenella mellea TaxID=50990 RepID=A0A4R5XET2_9AGAM|nr:cytochrome b5 [Rickenella mellea]